MNYNVILLDSVSPTDCSAPYRPLGMKDGNITDGQITASSEVPGFQAFKARFDGSSCWRSAKSSLGEYLEVNFGRKENVKAIKTQADPLQDNWTEEYYLAFSLGLGWKNVTRQLGRVEVRSSF